MFESDEAIPLCEKYDCTKPATIVYANVPDRRVLPYVETEVCDEHYIARWGQKKYDELMAMAREDGVIR